MGTQGSAGIGRRAAMAGAALAPGVALAQQPGTAPVGPPPSSAAAARAVAASRDAILRISREVWALAEPSLAETGSADIHLRELQAAGFRVESRGTAGVPTAFVAEWRQGGGGPVIGYLPEYDALPGLGNAAEPRRTPAPSGVGSGHGCGHNMIGAGCTGAAIALKRLMEEGRTAGTVRVYGCAAEEMEGAKVYMARAGLFDDCDAALAWHPAPVAGAGLLRLAATAKARVVFHGRTAHAGFAPWEGRSALKAAELFGQGVQMMREHVRPTARLHYIYESAGVAPNVVPDFAQIWIVAREATSVRVRELAQWLGEVAEGAARMTQTRAEFGVFYGTWELMPNEPLARLMMRHLAAVPLDWTAEEQAFARACQRELGVAEAGMATRPVPFVEDAAAGGSSDLGDVSQIAPLGVFAWPTLPLGVSLHTWPVTACGGMSIGDKASLATARILAAAGLDLITNAALREAARADLRRRREGQPPFASLLPPGRERPLNLPAFLVRTGDDEVVQGLAAGR